ncbi:3'-5' exoribonuclease [Bacillus sp. FJAT-29790]|uniref:3'-5' exonuclease n=1 Tax=Bacillus sp. FJAT-29790 TaxID=1895002 RepID=UPI001C211F24|nr:exonuclease domain-containing protein [Bacillus sp. FJAT-29790]MBU8878459.1 3'-5' exoribonuclease [Bacillus sp. FJAT-29790]
MKKRLNYRLGESLQLDTPVRDLSFTVFDTETTGFAIGANDRVIEIGGVLVEKMEVTDKTFQSFINPHRVIPAHITELTSIEQKHLEEAPSALEAIDQFFQFMVNHQSTGWVGHYLSFDAMVIKKELQREKFKFNEPMSFDTLDFINYLYPTWDMHDLEEYAHLFNTKVFTRHRALKDALTTAHVFVELLRRLEEKGITRLGDLLRLSGGKNNYYAL